MRLVWYGHACFGLYSDVGSIIFDPYMPNRVPGLTLPELSADLVVSSHEHFDHFYPEGVKLTGNSPDIDIHQISCYHDEKQGSLRGMNKMSVVTVENLRILHLGDLGHVPTEEQYAKMGKIHVLLLPVGGYYTIDAQQAKQIADRLQPDRIVPMHYRLGEEGLQTLDEIEAFLKFYPKDQILYLNNQELDLSSPITHKVIVFPWPNKK